MLSPKFPNRLAAAFAALVSASVLMAASIGPAVHNGAALIA